MNITAIKAGEIAVFKNSAKAGVPQNGEEKKAGRFDTFTLTGTDSKKTDKSPKTPDEKKAALIRGLSPANDEERALAAIDAYNELQRGINGRIRAYEKDIEFYSGKQSELSFWEAAKENGGKAAYGAKLLNGEYSEGQQLAPERIESEIAGIKRALALTVARWDRNYADPNKDQSAARINAAVNKKEAGYMRRCADIFNAVTGGGAPGEEEFGEGGCMDRFIDGISGDNFISKLSGRINELKSCSDSLTKAFNNYLDNNKTAEAVFKKYPKVIDLRRRIAENRERFGGLEKKIKDDLGVSDVFKDLLSRGISADTDMELMLK